jgi:hypothetical protein
VFDTKPMSAQNMHVCKLVCLSSAEMSKQRAMGVNLEFLGFQG